MKQRFVIFILLLSFALSVLAQNATNVRVRQEGETIVITYDLDKKANVRIWIAMGQSNQYTELKAVTGSVGKDISAGVNKQIIWQPLQEQTEFVAQNVRFKVEAKPYYYFSVSETKKVVFSPGNLQYRASTNTWRFAPHQWEYIGAANAKILITSDGWIDIFGWSGSTGAVKWGIGTSQSDSDYSGDFVDWGMNIGNGKMWYTLTGDEWLYLRFKRRNADKLIGVAHINLNADGTKYANGLILLPDNWIFTTGITFRSGFASAYSRRLMQTTKRSLFQIGRNWKQPARCFCLLPAIIIHMKSAICYMGRERIGLLRIIIRTVQMDSTFTRTLHTLAGHLAIVVWLSALCEIL